VTVEFHTILLQSGVFQKTILDKSEPVPFNPLITPLGIKAANGAQAPSRI
jgi:hypothetical protein